LSNIEFAKYFHTSKAIVIEELTKYRIYQAICSKCDHPRFRHGSYYSDYRIGIEKDRCGMDDCECERFTDSSPPSTKHRSPYTWEAARIHILNKIREAEENKIFYLRLGSYGETCGHCHAYQSRDHIAKHVYQKTIDNAKDDLNHIPEILELWKREGRDKEQDSSMPLRNSKSCAMFRCLLCFKYIFPDDAVSPHGAGYAHKVCANQRYLVRS
jgi:hypothetical protein